MNTLRDLRPLSKGETLKKWIRDNFENRPRAHFQKSLKKGGPFSNYFEKRVHFQTEFEKIPQARAQEARARARDPGPNGVFFQTQFENGFFFRISLNKDPFFIFV